MDGLHRIREALIRDAAATAPPGVCQFCGGFGTQYERIDDDRPAMAVPCWHCRVYCAACKRDVPKKGHACNAEVPEAAR